MAVKPTSTSTKGADADTAELARQVAELRADLARLTTLLGDVAQGKAEGFLHRMQQGASDIGGDAQAALKDGVAGIEGTLNDVSDYARKNPIHALAWAAGAGMLFGLIFGRR
jgi:ElaB/YqjD/DUF883 family membrane-anchored ribosome-binding protein